MGYYASDEIENAFEDMKNLLFPIDKGTWLRLGLLVLFTGSGIGFPNFPSGGYSGDTGNLDGFETQADGTDSGMQEAFQNTEMPSPTAAFGLARTSALIGVAVTIFIILIFFFVISSIFEFVYYQSLIDNEVKIRENTRKHLKNGLRLLALRFAVFALMAAVIIGTIASLFVNPIIGIFGILGILVLLLPVMVVMGLINNFAIPESIMNDRKFWEGIKVALGKARDEIGQTVVYILIRFGIKIAIQIALVFYIIIILIALLIPFGLLSAIAYFITPLLVSIPVLAGILAFIVFALAGGVVTQTYLRFYAIRVYENFGE